MEARARIADALVRLKDLYSEFPDTRLTPCEAAPLVGLDGHMCQALLTALEDVRFLERTADGCYQLRAWQYQSKTTGHAKTIPALPSRVP